MSYILDALRRADAERAKGQQSSLFSSFDAYPEATKRRSHWPWWWAGGVLLLGLTALVAWWLLRQGVAAEGAETMARASPAAPAPQPPGAPAPATATATVPGSAPESLPDPFPNAPPAERRAEPAPLPIVISAPPTPDPVLPRAAVVVRSTPPAPPPWTSPAVTPPSVPLANPSPVAAPRATPLDDLPEAQRRELPALTVGGSVWSDSAASRFIIVDGQVLREGDLVTPGLVLERIDRKSAVLRWRDMRLEIGL